VRKVLFIGDGVKFTGFSTVLTNIIKRLPQDKFDRHHLAINYYGDPHEYDWKIYPAALGGDLYGVGRLAKFNLSSFNGIFILNDVAVVDAYLRTIKKLNLPKIPPIIVYSPIDGYGIPARFFENFDIVKQFVVYTDFAYKDITDRIPSLNPVVIPHGVDSKQFYRLFNNREEAKKLLFSSMKLGADSFIILNANRNQPRKRIDLTLRAFELFWHDKKEKERNNIKLYLHCGQKDAGWYLRDLVKDLKLEGSVIMTESNDVMPQIPISSLNLLYNACDISVNFSEGEGWGLVNVEHAITGAPQVVANHTSLKELFSDVGLLVDIAEEIYGMDMSVLHGIVSVKDAARKLDKLYYDKELYEKLSLKSIEKFSQKKYDWDYIVEEQWIPLFDELWV